MISLLISLLVLLVVIYVANLVIESLSLPPRIKTVVYLIVGLIFLIVLLGQLGFVTPGLSFR